MKSHFFSEKLVWGFGGLLVPGLVGWGMALFMVVNDMNPTGTKVGLACSFPPALQIGLAIDGNWAPILVSVIGSLAVAGALVAFLRPEACSQLAASGRDYAANLLSKEADQEKKPKTSSGGSRGSGGSRKGKILKIIGLFGGGILTIGGIAVALFAWAHRPVEDSLAGAAELLARGGMDAWAIHDGPFVIIMGVAVGAIVLGLIGFTSALISIVWKRI